MSFLYFAYGSNMLKARLRERCPSAQAEGLAWAAGYAVRYWKEGRDGSGKATLVRQSIDTFLTCGVLYRIDLAERTDLDRAEARYLRHDDFAVHCSHSGENRRASAYLASPDACRQDLRPFDWYVGLIRAGAQEHGLDPQYIAKLTAVDTCRDSNLQRSIDMETLAARYG